MAKIISLLFLAACAAAQNTGNLTEFLLSQPDLSILTQAISLVPGLAGALPSEGITILAPVDSAFESLHEDLTTDVNALADLLSYHVLNGTYRSTDFEVSPTFVKTLFTGADVTGGQNAGFLKLGDTYQILSGNAAAAQVTEADIEVGGIVIHKIEEVLEIPQNVSTLAVRGGLRAAGAALLRANLIETVDTVEDLTLFAPLDVAFDFIASVVEGADEETLKSVLLYHAITGSVLFSTDASNVTVASAAGQDLTLSVINGTVFVNSARVVLPNIITSNGVIHVIDTVLNPAEVVDRGELNATGPNTPLYSGASSGLVSLLTIDPTAFITPIEAGPAYTSAPAVATDIGQTTAPITSSFSTSTSSVTSPSTSTTSDTAPSPTGENTASSIVGKGVFNSLCAAVVAVVYLVS